jgi:hypothetical protein
MFFDRNGNPIKEQNRLLEILKAFEPQDLWEILERRGTSAFVTGCSIGRGAGAPWLERTERTGVWLLSGSNWTGQDGKRIVRLNDYLCPPSSSDNEPPMSSGVILRKPAFVATPIDSSPVLLTVTFEIGAIEFTFNPESGWPFIDVDLSRSLSLLDVAVIVRSWQLDGSPAPHVSFSWECMADGSRRR